jgi:S-DNA-T family DNA segregation ATPase FtsK/SpoIIIE
MAVKRDTKSSVPRKRLVEEEVEAVTPPGLFREGVSIFIACLGVFLFLAIFSYIGSAVHQHAIPSSNTMGRGGFFTAQYLVDYLGYCAYAIVFCVFVLSYLVWRQSDEESRITPDRITMLFIFGTLLVLSCSTLASISFGYNGGGYLGSSIAVELDQLINKAGTVLVSIAAILISLSVIVDLRIYHYIKLLNLLFSGAKVAARDTGTALAVGAKAGGVCIKKIPEIVASKKNEEYEDLEEEEDEEPLSSYRKRRSARRVSSGKKPKWKLGEVVISDADDFSLEEEDEDQYDDEEDEIDEIEEEDEVEEVAAPPRILRGKKVEKSPRKAKKVLARVAKGKKNSNSNGRVEKYISGITQYDNYELPSRELLVGIDSSSVDGPDDDELLQNSRRLEQALRNFKLGGKVVEVHPGPVVTLYQFEPAAGIKVQRIINLADDLALALKVESVRVYAPVPGKGTVGIEVPNPEREIVRLRDLIDSDEYQSKPYPLSLALGKDTYGNSFIADLAKMPHLLIAGATGTGKSVCINSLLMSLLYRNSPKDLRLILIDPKMLELSIYEKIPHLLSPVVTNPKRARGVLYWAVEEMERRYSLMKDLGVRDLAMFNKAVSEEDTTVKHHSRSKKDSLITLEEKDVLSTTAAEALQREAGDGVSLRHSRKIDLEPMPRIVIVVDELADLMLTVGREIEELLTRLAQKARAAGIHLILATQRPSVNVITGLIKANFPARISFKVASKIDARTVMDQSGAERLLGMGDMLFLSPVVGRVKRLHSPFVSDQEVHDVVGWIQDQGEPNYDPEIERVMKIMEESEGKTSADGDSVDEYDPLYDQAVNLVIEKGQASTSMVQRVFRIGYNRAARILETMEREGVVGPADGAKPRQVISAPMQ